MPRGICKFKPRSLAVDCAEVECGCCTNCGICAELDYINSLTYTGRPIALSGTTPEDKAAEWICNTDPVVYDLDDVDDLTFMLRRYALLCLWYQNPDNTAADLTDGNVDECDWTITQCDGIRRLVGVDLFGLDLGGTIPPDVGHLKTLTKLELDENGLTGQLPSSLGNLLALTLLALSYNALTGKIPDSVSNWAQMSIWI